MNGAPNVDASWQEFRNQDGRPYYYNTATRKTQWHKPDALMNPAERAVQDSPWKEYTDPTSKRKYWHNPSTKETTWEMPQALKDAQAQLQAQPQTPAPQRQSTQPPAFVAGGSTPWASHPPSNRDRDEYPGPDRMHTDRQSGYGAADRSALPSSKTDPEYATFEEAEAAFMKSLKRAGVQPDWEWDQTIRATVKDPQFRALKDPRDRSAAFEKYVIEVRAQEKEKEKERVAKLRLDFTSMLRSHPEIKHYTRYKSALPIIENEAIFRSTSNEQERKQFFEEYIISLKKARLEKETNDRKAALDELTNILQSLNLEPYTRWGAARDQIQGSDQFVHDEKFKQLTQLDILNAFENHLKSLERRFNDERQRAKREKLRRERKNRDAFIDLLRDLKSANRLRAGAKWKDIQPLIEDDPRYVAMLGQGGSTPLDLFRDALEEEEPALRKQKSLALDVLEATRYELTAKTTFEEFLSIMQSDQRTANIDRDAMTVIFDRLRDKVLKRKDESRHHSDRHLRHAIDDLRYRIKRLEPPVNLGDTWEQVRPRLESYEEFRALDEGQRKSAFDKHLRRLGERDADDGRVSSRRDRDRDRERERREPREYRNGHSDSHRRHRTHTRSPEPDRYEEDRRRATADRELRHRQGGGSTGLSPPHRRDRDDRYERDGRGSRQVSVGHYDRERREREAERERSYITRADPRDRASELDYGDSRPSSTRRPRESDAESPDRRRESKRLRREVDSRERTFSPRLDRRSRTPAKAPELPKEDPGLRSGSEEGEMVEED